MALPLGSIPPDSFRPALAHSRRVAPQDGAAGFADRFERDLQSYPGETLDELRGQVAATAASESQQAGHSRHKGWLVGVAAALTWLAVPLAGTLVSAPIFYSAHKHLKVGKAHLQAAQEAEWFLAQLPKR